MTDSSRPLAIPPPPRHALPDGPTGGEAWLRDPSPAALAAIAVGLVVVVLASIVSAFATPRRPDLPPPIEGQAILASPALSKGAAEPPEASWSPPPVSLSSRSVLPTRTAEPSRAAAPTSQPASPKPSRSRSSKPPVAGPDELRPLSPTHERRLRSHGGGPETFIDFVNTRRERVAVYWLNYEGRRQRYALLEPGQSYRQQTYVGHPWVVTDERGGALVCFEPARHTSRAVIR